jgi:hypothetical protein
VPEQDYPLNDPDFILLLIAVFQKYPLALHPRIADIPQEGLLRGKGFLTRFFINAYVYTPIIDQELDFIIAQCPEQESAIKEFITKKRNKELSENDLYGDGGAARPHNPPAGL